MSTAISIPLSEAKAHLSRIVKDVRDAGTEYTVMLRNVPVATIVPVANEVVEESKTRGLLSAYADDALRKKEKGAFARAMKDKHAHLA